MRMRHLTALTAAAALVAVPLAVVGLPAGAADAAGHTFHDGRGDVWTGDDTSAPTKVGTLGNVDVVSSTVSFDDTALRFVVRYASLTAGTFKVSLVETIERADGTYLNVRVDTLGDARGVATIDTRCPGITTVVNYHDDVLKLTIPTSCVGKQSWVKVEGAAYGTVKNPSDGQYYVDDLQDHGAEPDTFSAKIRRR